MEAKKLTIETVKTLLTEDDLQEIGKYAYRNKWICVIHNPKYIAGTSDLLHGGVIIITAHNKDDAVINLVDGIANGKFSRLLHILYNYVIGSVRDISVYASENSCDRRYCKNLLKKSREERFVKIANELHSMEAYTSDEKIRNMIKSDEKFRADLIDYVSLLEEESCAISITEMKYRIF